ncbi:AAA family ATPase [Taibaiella sp. KBW10]|uniref:AAA family ATPase n=1 Tax=Taibaiella sp. KBW10 TaxID=2153357 RepID=UPI000F5AFF34|nr:MoxR family ATPase [Taibaiella sp. KBW10]RQO30003.1 AAA family ATPase [Taibaiella sp. KBW10]
MIQTFSSDVEAVHFLQQKYETLKSAIGNVVVGQAEVIEQLVIAILCNGHSLLVGVPGLAKTLLVKTLADAMDLSFKRVQFTPDLMPSDITGSEILDENRHFKFIKGPIFANIILADEINRTPPKTQAALLEAMQERNVTISGIEYNLPKPFFVLATQNPIEQEGTYPLPEAQLDRFMFLIKVDYPSFEEELQIVKQTTGNINAVVPKVLTGEEIIYFQSLIRKVPVPDNVLSYAVQMVQRTRPTIAGNELAAKYLAWGAGPRASQNLILAAKCHAVLHGKFSPDIEDVKAIATAVLRHRIVLNYKAATEDVTIESFIEKISG